MEDYDCRDTDYTLLRWESPVYHCRRAVLQDSLIRSSSFNNVLILHLPVSLLVMAADPLLQLKGNVEQLQHAWLGYL